MGQAHLLRSPIPTREGSSYLWCCRSQEAVSKAGIQATHGKSSRLAAIVNILFYTQALCVRPCVLIRELVNTVTIDIGSKKRNIIFP